jgi:hypothetical protein
MMTSIVSIITASGQPSSISKHMETARSKIANLPLLPVGNPKGRRPTGRPAHRYENNIKK